MPQNRRTNEDVFALAAFANDAEAQVTNGLAYDGLDADVTVPLTALLAYIRECKAARNFTALDSLQQLWDKA